MSGSESESPGGGALVSQAVDGPSKDTLRKVREVEPLVTGIREVLSTDPDADRVGLEIKLPDGAWFHFDGNQIAAILGYYLMLDPEGPQRRAASPRPRPRSPRARRPWGWACRGHR